MGLVGPVRPLAVDLHIHVTDTPGQGDQVRDLFYFSFHLVLRSL